jgi:hypothetical protein
MTNFFGPYYCEIQALYPSSPSIFVAVVLSPVRPSVESLRQCEVFSSEMRSKQRACTPRAPRNELLGTSVSVIIHRASPGGTLWHWKALEWVHVCAEACLPR